jgi:hypothetical protein
MDQDVTDPTGSIRHPSIRLHTSAVAAVIGLRGAIIDTDIRNEVLAALGSRQ